MYCIYSSTVPRDEAKSTEEAKSVMRVKRESISTHGGDLYGDHCAFRNQLTISTWIRYRCYCEDHEATNNEGLQYSNSLFCCASTSGIWNSSPTSRANPTGISSLNGSCQSCSNGMPLWLPCERKSHTEQRSIRSTIKDMGDTGVACQTAGTLPPTVREFWRPGLGFFGSGQAHGDGGGHMAATLVPCIEMNACRERL